MLILAIETSCDDTSVAIVKFENETPIVLANVVSSQIKIHNEYGGVYPVLAAREHEKNLPTVLNEALRLAQCDVSKIDLIAVTSGPGLIMSLVKGVNFAKQIAQENNKPLIGINHMAGHIYSNWLRRPSASEQVLSSPERMDVSFPALCLTVSGGHTELVLMKDHGDYELVGRTHDDAAGEAFDKIARLIGLEYPGGPAIAREALAHESAVVSHDACHKLPRPMLHSKDYYFSFSGLKTSVLYYVRDLEEPLEHKRAEIAHEAQEAIVDVLISKTKKAAEEFRPATILLSGGVSANKLLRQRLVALGELLAIPVVIPPMTYTTDNAAMIAVAAYFEAKNKSPKASNHSLDADANWELV